MVDALNEEDAVYAAETVVMGDWLLAQQLQENEWSIDKDNPLNQMLKVESTWDEYMQEGKYLLENDTKFSTDEIK